MKYLISTLLFFTVITTSTMAQNKTIKLRVIETSDVHGHFFPYDFINRKPMQGSLSRIVSYVDSLRKIYGENLLLFDNGDILQGQPTCYYCNYVKPEDKNLAAEILNYMKYDAHTIGNHDIETGHDVYDKWISEVECPTLGANIINTSTNKPYVNPYTIIIRDGIKIAVIGLVTPAIPNWLNESLWSGLRFEEMVSAAQYWMNEIQTNEKPDVIIGLFHSGKEGGIKTDKYMEDAALAVANEVSGFDLILYGHDHAEHCDIIQNKNGYNVVCLNPSCNALVLGDAEIILEVNKRNKVIDKRVKGRLVDVVDFPVNEAFINHFQYAIDSVKAYVEREIGTLTETIYTRDCYFGSAPFSDLIHDLQLEITGADISFNAPLTYDTSLKAGKIRVSDMFNLYKYENQIYVLMMTGEEIRRHLEMSCNLWVNTMTNPDDHIMKISKDARYEQQRYGFINLAFNFDSAAGIDYIVDVTKPDGEKVTILQMSDGKPFELSKMYKVAMNSYRGNGGGELLTKGAGIPHDKLKSRIVWESERDQRYYLTKAIEKKNKITPKAHNNWKFVPTEWTQPAIKRDKALLFGK